MKKIVITIIIFLFTATVTSYAGIFTNNEESTGQSGSLYGNISSNKSRGDSGFGGTLFGTSSDNPGGRPGEGDGIGQDAPLSDGLPVLLGCCAVLVFVKFFNRKKESKIIVKNNDSKTEL